MQRVKPGVIVGRKSYNSDILFCVKQVEEVHGEKRAELKGIDVRLRADAPVEDLEVKDPEEIFQYRHKSIERDNRKLRSILAERELKREAGDGFRGRGEGEVDHPTYFEMPGTVVHLDGDQEYLEKCMRNYMRLEVDARGFFVPEEDQPEKVVEILYEQNADILVVTGHDGFIKGKKDFADVNNYHSSKHFVESVRRARRIEPSKDALVIFAGACQSHYEAIIEAGANFASSPQRVLIHAYDPIFLVERIAFTSFNELLSIEDIVKNTITGSDGIGGIETRGRFRRGYPKSPY